MSHQLAPLNAGLERMHRKLSLFGVEAGDPLEQLEVLRSTAFEFGCGLHGAALEIRATLFMGAPVLDSHVTAIVAPDSNGPM